MYSIAKLHVRTVQAELPSPPSPPSPSPEKFLGHVMTVRPYIRPCVRICCLYFTTYPGKQDNSALKSPRNMFFCVLYRSINILELKLKTKYAKEYSNLKKWTSKSKSDKMSFRLHEAKYGWKMLPDFKRFGRYC